jgi:hypothetical protein
MPSIESRPVRALSLWEYLNQFNEWQTQVAGISQDGPNLTGTNVATSLLAAGSKIVIPKSAFVVGRSLRIRVAGRISNIVTTPGTLTLDLRLTSPVPTTVIVANGGAMQLNAVAKTTLPFLLEWLLTVRAVGASANFMHQGLFISESVVASPLPAAGGTGQLIIPATVPTVGSNFDSTVNETLDLFGTFSLSNANAIQVHQYMVEQIPS